MTMNADFGPGHASPWGPATNAGGDASRRTRHAELLILCARIDFNP
jgi:hypothetical protein